MAEASAGNVALPSLTGLRIVAAGIVFFSHISYANLFASQTVAKNFFDLFNQVGLGAVGFFFVLSGFIMTWSARPTDTPRKYWRRRVFRIWPNHLVTFVVAYALISWVSNQPVDARDAGLNLFLLHTWVPSLNTIFSGNPVTWSMAVELPFYFAFPFLLRLFNKIRPAHLWTWAGGIVLAIFVLPAVATNTLPDQPFVPGAGPEKQFWFVNFFPPTRMLEFLFGIVLARVVLTGRRLPIGLGGAVALAIGGCAIGHMVPWSYHLAALMAVPAGLIVATAAAGDVAGRRSWVASPLMVRLGELAYAFYLWHLLVIYYLHDWLSTGTAFPVILTGPSVHDSFATPVAFAIIALLLAISLVLAWATYVLVERPVYRRFAGRRRRAPVTALPTAPETQVRRSA